MLVKRIVLGVFDFRPTYILLPLPHEEKYIDNQKNLISRMRISTEMARAINDQISYEASSANTYIAMGSWCERIGYDGSAAFFFGQAAEENGHMLKLINYMNGVGAEAIIPAIEKPPSNFESLEYTFQFGLKSEQTVTMAIYDLVDMAEKEKDRSTYSFLQWFVSEQIEEETLFHTILQKFDLLGKDKLAVYQIDQSLASVRSQVMNKQTNLK
ncbi:MAG TPA: ferritin [Nitrososphaeraceae archaeon]|jgi:ferritin|nr:ferritin [Nitrososphaeraceae archaeon]